MIPVALAAAAACLGAVALISLSAAAGLGLLRATRVGIVLAQTALVAHAVVALVAQLLGDRPAEPSTFWGYLAVSVFLVPLLVGRGSLTLDLGRAPSRSDLLVVSLACAVSIVVLWRLDSTWG